MVDTGHTTMPGVIAQYRRACYHLKKCMSCRPENEWELFNLCYSKVECAFGILKTQFKTLTSHPFLLSQLRSMPCMFAACCTVSSLLWHLMILCSYCLKMSYYPMAKRLSRLSILSPRARDGIGIRVGNGKLVGIALQSICGVVS